ncbi:MAG: regulatory protein RecX [Clostridiales bacterium]|nr:regulatory protein RecX [Clostridiales bacterium]
MLKIDLVEKYKGSTYKVELSTGEVYFWNVEIILDCHIKTGTEISQEDLDEAILANEYRKARERALYLLDYRDHSYVELFKKLEKNYSEETCYKVMGRMVELGVINDNRYAERLAEKLTNVKKYGYYRAKQEMYLKGLDKELIENCLAEYADDTLSRLSELVEKKYARKIVGRDSLNKVKNALVRNGYSYSDINKVLDEYKAALIEQDEY